MRKEETSDRQIPLSPPAQTFAHPLDLVLAAIDILPETVTIESNRMIATFRRIHPGQLVAPSDNEKGAA